MKEIEYNEAGFLKNMRDLEKSYRATHRIVRQSINVLDAAEVGDYYQKTGKHVVLEHTDTKLKEGMIEDLNIAINQMHSGREAGSKRGIHRKGAYDADKLIDPLYIQSYFTPTNSRSPSTLTNYHIEQIKDALSCLTEPEWRCYVMARGYCATFAEIASMLAVTKGTVQKNVERADRKVKKALDESMFLREFEWERSESNE